MIKTSKRHLKDVIGARWQQPYLGYFGFAFLQWKEIETRRPSLLLLLLYFYNLLSKSTGLDGIPARFLRDAADIIVPTVTFIFNLSSKKGIVPSDTKIDFIRKQINKGRMCGRVLLDLQVIHSILLDNLSVMG